VFPVADTFTRAERSRIMAAVKSRGNELTELRLARLFRRYHITGWRRHLALTGNPDFTFQAKRVVVFVDGCFWHGCTHHLRMPQSNKTYWEKKISRNVIRDRITCKALRAKGWKVIRIWEHELLNEEQLVRRLQRIFASQN
jgi:DNA mismatch endonuclease, patch repair protein